MKSQNAWSGLVFATIGGILENPQWIAVRIVPWLVILVSARFWVAALLLCGIIAGPMLVEQSAVPQWARWGFDAVLFLLAWGTLVIRLDGWALATILAASYIGVLYWKGMLFANDGQGQLMSIFKPDQSVDPTMFANQIVAIVHQILSNHGLMLRSVLRNKTELKRFQYKASLEPKGQVEVICFDDKFPGHATYPYPLIGNVDTMLNLRGFSQVTPESILDEIYAAVQRTFPGVNRMMG